MKKLLILVPLVAISILLISCKTITEIPMEKTSAQIIQMGQNAVTSADYKSAEFCYKTALERFSTNPQVLVEAKYELGNVYLKQKKYALAYAEFSQLLELYDSAPTAYPSAYKKLAQIGISKIPHNKIQN